ncbi:hypothetical protein D3C78_1770530 [compost metagenome]
MHVEAIEARCGGAADLFLDDHRDPPVEADAAIGLGRGGVEQAELASAPPDIARHPMVRLPVLVERHAFFVEEASHGVAKRRVLGFKQGAGDHLASPR